MPIQPVVFVSFPANYSGSVIQVVSKKSASIVTRIERVRVKTESYLVNVRGLENSDKLNQV